MGFSLLTFLEKVLGFVSLPDLEAEATAWLSEHGEEYPDINDRADALAAFLSKTLKESAPELDPAKMKNTILGVARDVVSGDAGVDHDSWGGIG